MQLAWIPRWAKPPDELLPAVKNNGTFVGSAQPNHRARFPQFLGPTRSAGIDRISLARDWTKQPPQMLWRQQIGAGHSGFVVVNGFAVTMEQRGDKELVSCYDALTGAPNGRPA